MKLGRLFFQIVGWLIPPFDLLAQSALLITSRTHGCAQSAQATAKTKCYASQANRGRRMLSLKIAVTGFAVALLAWLSLQTLTPDERVDVALVVAVTIGILVGWLGFLAWVWI